MVAEKLIKRQLKKAKIDEYKQITPERMERFLALVKESYEAYERDRLFMERSIEISSKEMQRLNAQLLAKVQEVGHLNETLSARVAEEVEKNRQKDQVMLQQTRLAQMGEMLGMIAHQWRQPLTAISSVAISLQMKIELGKFRFADQEQQREFEELFMSKLGAITDYVRYLSDTIDDFRNFFRPDKSKEHTSMERLIHKATQMLEGTFARYNISVVERIDSECEVTTYANEVLQVLLNILKNATDNFKERSISRPRIEIVLEERDRLAVVEIADNGGGIPEEIMGRIFDPYFSTKDEKNGTGLGLYMSRTIIEEHCGGKLEALNSGEGALFRITLPLDPKEDGALYLPQKERGESRFSVQ